MLQPIYRLLGDAGLSPDALVASEDKDGTMILQPASARLLRGGTVAVTIVAMMLPLTASSQPVLPGDDVALDVALAPAWQPHVQSELLHASADQTEMQDHYGISEEDALVRIRVEDATPNLQTRADNEWPGTFAGMWIHTDGEPLVSVAFTQDAAANVEALKPFFPHPELLRPVTAAHALGDLLSLHAAIKADRALAQDPLTSDQLPAPMAQTQGMYDIDTDVVRNRVVVFLQTLDPGVVQAFSDRYGTERMTFEQGVAEETCTRRIAGTRCEAGSSSQ